MQWRGPETGDSALRAHTEKEACGISSLHAVCPLVFLVHACLQLRGASLSPEAIPLRRVNPRSSAQVGGKAVTPLHRGREESRGPTAQMDGGMGGWMDFPTATYYIGFQALILFLFPHALYFLSNVMSPLLEPAKVLVPCNQSALFSTFSDLNLWPFGHLLLISHPGGFCLFNAFAVS